MVSTWQVTPEALEYLRAMTRECFLEETWLKQTLLWGWEFAVNRAMDDNILSQEEEASVLSLAEQLGLTQEDVASTKAMVRAAQGAMLRDLDAGLLKARATWDADTSGVLLKPDETLLWCHGTCVKMRRTPGGKVRTDGGKFCVTQKTIFFTGKDSVERVMIKNVQHVQGTELGFVLDHGTTASNRLEFAFGGNQVSGYEGWFFTNLITRLQARQLEGV